MGSDSGKPVAPFAVRRLVNQHLAAPVFGRAAEVVAWLGAVQAQEYGPAKWALGLRMKDATDASIDEAFNEGSILRTHVMRPTWHFVSPADIRWMLALTGPRIRQASRYQFERLGLESATLSRAAEIITKAIDQAGPQTRDELRKALDSNGIRTDTPLRMIYILFHAEIEGLICSGPRRGKQFTYALLEKRAPPAKPLGRDESLARLARRFFTSHGPATVQDMAKWSGLTVADARAGLDSNRSDLARETVGGREYWGSRAAESLQNGIRDTHLLPIYDEYTIGYRFHAPVFDSANTDKVPFLNPLVVEGKVAGTWKRVERKDSILAQVKPFASRIHTAAVREAADRFSAFMGKPVEVEWV